MKKLLGLLSVAPFAITACGGTKTTDAKLERSDDVATAEVKAAFKDMLEAATGKTYDSTDGDNLTVLDGRKFEDFGLLEGNWFGQSGSLFEQADIDALTVGQAYRAAMYFGIDTFAPFTNLAAQSGQLLNGFMANTVNGVKQSAPAAFFPTEAKALIDAIKEAEGDTHDYLLQSYQNTGSREEIFSAMSRSLGAIGVHAEAVTTDWDTHLADTQSGKHGAYIGGWGTVTNHPAYGLYGPYHTEAGATGGNRGFYSNAKVDEALDAGKASSAGDWTHYHEAQDLIAKDFMQVPLYVGNRKSLKKGVAIPTDALQKDGSHYYHGFDTGTESETVNIGVTGNFASLHPHGSNDSGSTNINKQVYQTLWNQNSHATAEGAAAGVTFDPVLMANNPTTDAEWNDLENNGRITIDIDTTAKWHDNDTLTSLQVVESINRAIKATPISAVTNGILGAKVIDADTVEIITGSPKPTYTGDYGDWVSENNDSIDETDLDVETFSSWKQNLAHAGFAINKVDIDDHKDTVASIVGTGPYKVKEIVTTTKDVTLEAVADHAMAADVKNGGLLFKVISDDTTRMNEYDDGGLHFVDAVTTANFDAHSTPGNKLEFPTWVTGFIGFNLNQF